MSTLDLLLSVINELKHPYYRRQIIFIHNLQLESK